MKTGEDVKARALILLNYTDQDGRLNGDLYRDVYARSLAVVNQIYSDLWFVVGCKGFEELASLNDEIDLPARVINDVMPYGVAMLMAQTIGDADNQSLYSSLYNQKRSGLTNRNRRADVMPNVWG